MSDYRTVNVSEAKSYTRLAQLVNEVCIDLKLDPSTALVIEQAVVLKAREQGLLVVKR